jgi:hypothetical protein
VTCTGILGLRKRRGAHKRWNVAAPLEYLYHPVELLERGLRTPSQRVEAFGNDIWGRGRFIPEGMAKDFLVDIVLLETVHEDLDVLRKIRCSMSISLL